MIAPRTAEAHYEDLMLADSTSTGAENPGTELLDNLLRSLKTRWWYYLLVSIVAIATAYQITQEFGRHEYTLTSDVRSVDLPLPIGNAHYEAPRISEFGKYLLRPEVAERLRERFAIAVTTEDLAEFLEHKYDRGSETVSVTITHDTAESAAAILNQCVGDAITLSTQERVDFLESAEDYFVQLMGKAEAEAASNRRARAKLIDALDAQSPDLSHAQFDFEDLTDAIRAQRSVVLTGQLELENLDRKLSLLIEQEKQLISNIQRAAAEDCQSRLEKTLQVFSSQSAQAKAIASKTQELAELADQSLSESSELGNYLRRLSELAGSDIEIPPKYAEELDHIEEQIGSVRVQQKVLPAQIDYAKKLQAQLASERSQIDVDSDADVEDHPELQELTAQIRRAENDVEETMRSIDWVRDVLTLKQPAFSQIATAVAESAESEGNHKKVFVASFGVVGLLLGFPVLLFDLLRSSKSPSSKLGQEFGLPMIATESLGDRKNPTPNPHSYDQELRLLANRIQRSGRSSPGAVIMFNSLADHVSTDALTGNIARCLVAREERVIIVDLETIESHRQGKVAGLPSPQDIDPPSGGDDARPGPVEHDRIGLALALASATKNPRDVYVEQGRDGISRVHLGDGELPPEAFATPLMSRLLEQYRKEYTLVLLSGPAAKHLADVQMLSAYCDGTFFVAPRQGQVAASARRTITDLLSHRTRVMGIVEVPT